MRGVEPRRAEPVGFSGRTTALITSTIYPPDKPTYGVDLPSRSWVSPEVRLEQTIRSVQSLRALGVADVVIADNSGRRWNPAVVSQLAPAQIHVFDHYQYRNKGISEMYLVQAAIPLLKSDRVIVKLSGRYTLTRPVWELLGEADVLGRLHRQGRSRSLSTRCYVVKDRTTLENMVTYTLRELFGRASRITGPRSAWRVIRNSLVPRRDSFPYEDPPFAIEGAVADAVARLGYRLAEAQELGVTGALAGNPGDLLVE